MPGIIAAAMPHMATGVAALLGFQGQKDANAANAHQAQLNRDFQERMANTAYQRAVADMKAAGLNPALAYQNGGADSPTGTTAAPMQNTLGSGVTSAGAALQAYAGLAQTVAQIKKTDAEAEQVRLQTYLMDQRQGWENAILENNSGNLAALSQLLQQPEYIATLRKQMLADLKLTDSHAAEADARTKNIRLLEPGLQNEANAANTLWGRYARPYLNDAGTILGAASQLMLPAAVRNVMSKTPKIRPFTPETPKKIIGFFQRK